MADPYERVLVPPRGSFFLVGVRGVGKSTWARARFPDATRFDLLDERRYHELLGQPGAFADALRAVPTGATVVVDEVQRMPSLLNEVHRAIEMTLPGYGGDEIRGTPHLTGAAGRRPGP
jgi:hypothetical protein